MLKINHNAGFFSCCNIRLRKIIEFFNINKILPTHVDSSEQFKMYNPYEYDITNIFFKKVDNQILNYEKEINLTRAGGEDQFTDYKLINFTEVNPFLQIYFSPSEEIINIKNYLLKKYCIDCDNLIAVYYRGTDKHSETKLGEFKFYIDKIDEINIDNKTIIVQSDSFYFIDELKKKYEKIIVIEENKSSKNNTGVHKENNKEQNFNEIKYLFATFLILSECKHLIISSSNCSLWMVLYRQNNENIHQFLNTNFI